MTNNYILVNTSRYGFGTGGMTMKDVYKVFQSFGVTDCLRFDSGGSPAIYVNDSGNNIYNSVGINRGSSDRRISTALLIYKYQK